MESVFSNGGVIGATLDYKSTEQYIIGTTTGPATIEMVGTTGIITTTSSTLTLPTGLQEGDLVVLASAADASSLTLPAGFTPGQSGNSNSVDYLWAYKFMGATPDTSITGLVTDANRASHLAVAFRGVDTTTPLAVASPSVATGVDVGQPNPPAVGSVTAGSLVLALGFLDDDLVAATVGAPSGYTLAAASQGSSLGSTVMAAYRTPTENGTADPGAFTGGTDSWVGATAVLKQATVTVPVYGNKKNSGIWNLESVFDATAPFYGNTVEYLVIAGGGGAGANSNDSGGGGAGGYRSSVTGEMSGGGASAESPLTITPGIAYTVTVGAGGASDSNGSDSVFASITSLGGGFGAEGGSSTVPAGAGGSGGGANNSSGTGLIGAAGTAGQGYAGGNGATDSAGGGGAGGLGGNAFNATPAGTSAGGIGVTSSITGTAVGRAGGGGGGVDTAGTGTATDGGGAGSTGSIGTAGTVNTGGGGGGAGGTGGTTQAAGGSGVVILRYPAAMTTPTISAGLTATTTTVGANKVTVFTAGTGTVTF